MTPKFESYGDITSGQWRSLRTYQRQNSFWNKSHWIVWDSFLQAQLIKLSRVLESLTRVR